MQVKDMPLDADLIQNSQDIIQILSDMGRTESYYGCLFVLKTGEVYGFVNIIPYLDLEVDHLGNIDEVC